MTWAQYKNFFLPRNGEEWYKMRHSVQKLMMGPDAAVAYLPAQNKVADDFLNVIKEKLRKNEEIPDFYNELINYTMECESN